MIPDSAEAHGGYLYLKQEYGQGNYNPPCAIVTGATDLGDNIYELTYEVYSAGGMLLPSDIPESTYGLSKDQFIAAIQADASRAVPRLARSASRRVTAPRPSRCLKWASTTRLGV